MSTANPIVVGVDGTSVSERALQWAMDEALVRDCPLHVVHAWNYEPLADWTQTDAARGMPASEALEQQSVGAAMLVVATHSGHWLRKTVLGSTSTHCVRHSSAPVLVIPVQREARNEQSHAADHS
ncbi:universal stress protein [Lentzea sp. NPDC042327]|uniref:universal stress protein n=1 Tax=Lentzea sp. NPDC042327 TaxID=3154801 RepID=UPI0033FEF976